MTSELFSIAKMPIHPNKKFYTFPPKKNRRNATLSYKPTV
jgi:hypothetical protein